MPLHLNSITNDSRNAETLAWILQDGVDECDSVFITEDRKYLHIRGPIKDLRSGEKIGQIIYTLKMKEDALEVLDIDMVWNNDRPTKLRFNTLRAGSSDANEYYEAETADDEQHLEVETVNRHTTHEELLDTEREVYVSAFPFSLTVFSGIDAFNEWAGFKEERSIVDTGLKIGGFAETFMMPGGLLDPNKKQDESYSFIIGKVVSYRDVEIAFGKTVLPFVLAQVETGLGIIPISMGRDVFNLSELKNGCIIAMNADIKVDVAKEGDYSCPKNS